MLILFVGWLLRLFFLNALHSGSGHRLRFCDGLQVFGVSLLLRSVIQAHIRCRALHTLRAVVQRVAVLSRSDSRYPLRRLLLGDVNRMEGNG